MFSVRRAIAPCHQHGEISYRYADLLAVTGMRPALVEARDADADADLAFDLGQAGFPDRFRVLQERGHYGAQRVQAGERPD